MSMQGLGCWHVKYRTNTKVQQIHEIFYENWQEQQWNSNSMSLPPTGDCLCMCVCVRAHLNDTRIFLIFSTVEKRTCKNSICALSEQHLNEQQQQQTMQHATTNTHSYTLTHPSTHPLIHSVCMNLLNWFAKTATLQRTQLTNWPINWWANTQGRTGGEREGRGGQIDCLMDVSVCHISCFPICKCSIPQIEMQRCELCWWHMTCKERERESQRERESLQQLTDVLAYR